MYACHAFRRKTDRRPGKHDVIVDQRRAMAYLHEDILAAHGAFCHRRPFRRMVIMKKVLGDTRPLCFPVRPDPHGGVMNMVAAHHYVDRGMKLDP